MSSILVLLVLAALWVAVLVPAARARLDRGGDWRSLDRFASGMRVLSRRQHNTAGRRWVVTPPRPGDPEEEGQETILEAAYDALRARWSPATLVQRRRRTVLGLAAAVLLTLLLSAVAGPWWLLLQLPADAALGAVLVWCVRSAARERARRDALAAEREFADALADVRVLRRGPRASTSVPVMTVPLGGHATARPARAVVAAYASVRPVAAEPAAGVRLIDLGEAGSWRRVRPSGDALLGERPGIADWEDPGADAGLDALLDRRQAASGW